MMKKCMIIFFMLGVKVLFGQVADDFADGNFTVAPTWAGSNSSIDFTILSNQLRSNSVTPSSNFYLSTQSSLANNCTWEFWVNLKFLTSGANYIDVYLVSDQANLQAGSINGYFVRVGGTNDEISLFKRSGSLSSSTILIDGVNSTVNSSDNILRIRVSRSDAGVFILERDLTGGTNYISEGSATDNTFNSTSAFGIYVQQSTASFHQKHFFDDIKVQRIVTDSEPPRLLSATVVDSVTIEVLFSEAVDSVSALNRNNYIIDHTVGNPTTVVRTGPAKYRLRLASALATNTYQVLTANIKDLNNNIIGSNNTTSFSHIKPYLPVWGDLVINEIFADPSPQIDLPSVEFIELYNTSQKTLYLQGWKYGDATTTVSLGIDSIAPQSFLILSSKADTSQYKVYGKTIGLATWPSLNNTSDVLKLYNAQNHLIDSVSYSDTWYRDASKRTGGWTLERVDPRSRCGGIFNWKASKDTTGGTPGRVNSVYYLNYDGLAFKADSLRLLSDSTLTVFVNKPADGTSINPGTFQLNPANTLKSFKTDTYSTSITLHFTKSFIDNTNYSLAISALKDCSGNTINPATLTFKTPRIRVDTGKVIITEIFADPSPEIGLPLAEFIELYNPGIDSLDLDGWSISDHTTQSVLRKVKIAPGQYLVLCPIADTVHYKHYGYTYGLLQWPSLSNAADQIVLRSQNGRMSDSVSYSDQWYKDPSKKNGGYSLEKIDPLSACNNTLGWSASRNSSGGTPGKVNSVFIKGYDLNPIIPDSLRILNDSTLIVYFNKTIDSTSITRNSIILDPPTPDLSFFKTSNDLKSITLAFNKKFDYSTSYSIKLKNIQSCNTILAEQSVIFKTRPAPIVRIDTGVVIITEIFTDPSPEVGLPPAEFIEVHNPGTDTLNLDGWTLSGNMIRKVTIPPSAYLILTSWADSNNYLPYGKVHGMSQWKSLTNGAGTVILKSFKGRLIDSVVYSDKWYKNPAKAQGGWSLEKTDYSGKVCSDFYNWGASINLTGGTPGKQNSLFNSSYFNNSIRIDSIRLLSDSTLAVYLNRPPDTSSIKNAAYTIDGTIGLTKLTKVDATFTRLDLLLPSAVMENTKYMLSINGLSDCSGSTKTIHESFTSPMVPELNFPVIINEIFADSNPSYGLPDTEFIELYNPTSVAVNLAGMVYQDETTRFIFRSGKIDASDYLILCPVKDTLNFKPFGKVIGISPWPSLNNDRDVLTLFNNKGKVMNRVSYSDKWYKDETKRTGGYSLELIDPSAVCTGIQNWAASVNSAGGTPGKQNSVHRINHIADPLKVVSVEIIDSLTLKISLNRSIDSMSVTASHFIINNGVGNPAHAHPIGPDFNSIQLGLTNPMTRGALYKITATSLTDCAGQALSVAANSAETFYPKYISRNSIIINEILFNPRPNGVDFVEIYNNSPDILDLSELALATTNLNDSLISQRPVSNTKLLIHPGQYFALSVDPDNIKANYSVHDPNAFIKMTGMPSFNDDRGIAVLVSRNSRVDQVNYDANMHYKLIKDPEGVSLERSSFNRPANESGNFRSATQAAGYSTPGYKNSQFADDPKSTESVMLASTTFSPDNDGFEDQLQLNYKFEKAGLSANITIYNDKGILIRKLSNNSTLNAEGVINWDGFDQRNSLCPLGIYIVYAEIFDLAGSIKKYRLPFVLAAKLK